ncbi:MAG: helix-turn-helix domain-containing protein [Alphaproteobacteria bacterium]|nr:helix-turn-helix domain-containing protein [Alphaproteobacteria bacterium]
MAERKRRRYGRERAYQEKAAAIRRKYPHRYVRDTDQIIYIENVADMLNCSVAKVRTIPSSELPRTKVGKRLVFHRAEVEEYVRRKSIADRDNAKAKQAGAPRLEKTSPKLRDRTRGPTKLIDRARD